MDRGIDMQEINKLKQHLYELCRNFALQKIKTAETALEQAREASNEDTKSSAGDKYETSREMMQQEIDRNRKLLLDARESLKALDLIREQQELFMKNRKNDKKKSTVHPGSLVVTGNGSFYIGISAGQLKPLSENELTEQDISVFTPFFAVSPASPIGKLLLGKKEGMVFEFNGLIYTVGRVF